MSDPGISNTSIVPPILIAFIVTLYLILLFKRVLFFKNVVEKTALYNILLYVLLPIIVYLCTFGLKAIKCDVANAALGSLPVIGTVYIALLISYFPTCRIPIVSALVSGDVVANAPNIRMPNTDSTCCNKKISVTYVESKNMLIKAVAYGFYLSFAVFFGIVIGDGYSPC